MGSSVTRQRHHLELAEEWGLKVWCRMCKITFDSLMIAGKVSCGEDVSKLPEEILSRLSGYEIK